MRPAEEARAEDDVGAAVEDRLRAAPGSRPGRTRGRRPGRPRRSRCSRASAVRMAAPLPMLCGWCTTTSTRPACFSSSRMAPERSREKSSTQTTSIGSSTARTRSITVRSVRSSLYTGTSTDSRSCDGGMGVSPRSASLALRPVVTWPSLQQRVFGLWGQTLNLRILHGCGVCTAMGSNLESVHFERLRGLTPGTCMGSDPTNVRSGDEGREDPGAVLRDLQRQLGVGAGAAEVHDGDRAGRARGPRGRSGSRSRPSATSRRRGARPRRTSPGTHSSTRGRGTFSPKKTTSGLRTPPHSGQSGTRKPSRAAATVGVAVGRRAARARASPGSSGQQAPARPRGRAGPRTRGSSTTSSRPCRSITRRLPARWCSPSTFCVTSRTTRPAPLERGERAVRGVRAGVADARPAAEAPAPSSAAAPTGSRRTRRSSSAGGASRRPSPSR